MDVREKLVEICFREFCMVAGDSPCGCDGCHYGKYGSDECYEEYKKDKMAKLEKAGVTVQEWISVKDRLQEKDIRVLVWMKDNEEGYTQMDTDRWSCTMEQGYHWIRWGKSVTHWMPLPQPPKGE